MPWPCPSRAAAETCAIRRSRPHAAWLGQSPEALVGQPIRAVVGEAAFAAPAPYFARVLAGEVL